MPKKFTDLAESIKNCSQPVIVMLSQGEIASKKTTLRAFSDGEGVNLVTNLDKVYSPVTGEYLANLPESEQACEGDQFGELDNLHAMKTETDVVFGVDPDLAFALASDPSYCPLTGKETVFHYIELADDDSSNDSSDEEEFDNVDDSMSDDDSEDNDEYSESEEEEIFEDNSEDESKSENTDDIEAASEEVIETLSDPAQEPVQEQVQEAAQEPVQEAVQEPVTEQANEQEEQPPVQEEVVNEGIQQEIPAIAVADETANLKLVSLTQDNSEIAAFIGGVHVGTLKRTMASETAAPLFDNGMKLVSAFKPVFHRNRSDQKSSELAAYGYTPVTFKVNVGELFNKRLEKETASIKTEADIRVQNSISDMSKLIELAFVGINKGLFEGNNDLASELSSLLARNGIKNPQREVRRVLAKHSHNYIKAGVEKAKELSSKSEDYIQGIAETVSKSEFVSYEDETKSEVASYVPPVNKYEPMEFIGQVEPNKPKENKYRKLFR